MHPPESTGAARPLTGNGLPTTTHPRLYGEHNTLRDLAEGKGVSPPLARRPRFATCGVRGALPIRDSRNAGHAHA